MASEPRQQTDLIVVTVPDDVPAEQVPAWLTSGAIYLRSEVAAWVDAAEQHDVVATGSVELRPHSSAALPVYQLRALG